MTEFEKYLARLVASHEGKKIMAVIAGGGVSVSRLAMIPGSSKILGATWMPYDQDETVTWMEARDVSGKAFQEKAVCVLAAKELHNAMVHVYGDSNLLLSITASLTTNRHRKGENQAFILTSADDNVYHLKLDKLDESVYNDPIKPWVEQKIFYKRQEEDEKIATVALKLLTGFEKDTLESDFANGNLTRIL